MGFSKRTPYNLAQYYIVQAITFLVTKRPFYPTPLSLYFYQPSLRFFHKK